MDLTLDKRGVALMGLYLSCSFLAALVCVLAFADVSFHSDRPLMLITGDSFAVRFHQEGFAHVKGWELDGFEVRNVLAFTTKDVLNAIRRDSSLSGRVSRLLLLVGYHDVGILSLPDATIRANVERIFEASGCTECEWIDTRDQAQFPVERTDGIHLTKEGYDGIAEGLPW